MDRDTQIRIEACRLAAEAFNSPAMTGTNAANDLWCLAVFFETYIRDGAKGTRKDFGPKGPAKLRVAEIRKIVSQSRVAPSYTR